MPYEQKQWKDKVVDITTGQVIQQGTPVSAGNMNRIEQGIADAHAQLEQSGRQTQTLVHGLNVLNGGVNAPVNLQIDGRTLISMLNSDLDPLKYYVLADKKTKLTYNGVEYQGIAKFTAVAGKPATIKRIANFEGKVSGSTLENPHVAKLMKDTVLRSPSGSWSELPQANCDNLKTIDSKLVSYNGATSNGEMSQKLFSFDIIQEIERNIGKIPRSTLADKVAWAKANIAKITCNWWGFGSNASGYKATLAYWFVPDSKWGNTIATHSNSVVTKLANTPTITSCIDSNGFIHFLAYAEPSDGVTPSTINTDYVELEIELVPGAQLHAPRVPLYEITKEHYDAINVTWSEAETLARYPQVEGVQHLQNPYVMAEGENLLPPFSEWVLSGDATLKELNTINVKVGSAYSPKVNVIPNQTYTTSRIGTKRTYLRQYDSSGTQIRIDTLSSPQTIKMAANAVTADIFINPFSTDTDFMDMSSVMLTLGSVAKPFVPRNPSYTLFDTKLGKIGDVADWLYEQDGKYFVRKAIEKDLILDGSLAWVFRNRYTFYKWVSFSGLSNILNNNSYLRIVKYDGMLLKQTNINENEGVDTDGNSIYLGINNTDTGFGETYTPVTDEIKAYFNGWKVKTADANGKPTAWTSLGDGTDAPTQTLDYVKANRAPNFTPYKLSYVLATPQISEVKSEGSISVNGLTQVEVGSGVIVREKANPIKHVSTEAFYHLNYDNSIPSLIPTQLKNRLSKFIEIYKNGVKDTKNWMFSTSCANGNQRALIKQSDFDPTAEYTVTYIVYDKNTFTTNVTNLIALYANNIRSALDDAVKKVEDVKTETSVNSLLLYDVIKRLKAGGL